MKSLGINKLSVNPLFTNKMINGINNPTTRYQLSREVCYWSNTIILSDNK